MMHDRANDVTVFDNAELRNTWETRANQYKAKTEFEDERRQKSALPQLFDQWHQRWSCRKGIPVAPEKKEWSDSWRLLNPEPHKEQESWSDKSTLKDSLNGLLHMEKPPTSEWSDSWKVPKSSSPSSQVNSENIPESEWGASWKFVNTQYNLEGVPWSQRDECDFPDTAQTKNKLTVLSRGDRSSNCFDDELQLCLTEWNESWKLLKTQSQEQHEARSK
ncbi:hypothetical protein SKAU_G00361570 [Synaphobranchus kaupii]|uniref:Uncharacterized protein n=1 Tax=Synaphobranchus kaupii TaxID=118154 RepID=A0A9Q1EIF1_SYNKA|nr:hypothetical protein SKAU_G00361570 [Synaphobranchus kaupii]